VQAAFPSHPDFVNNYKQFLIFNASELFSDLCVHYSGVWLGYTGTKVVGLVDPQSVSAYPGHLVKYIYVFF
jgi:hypothetical protein